ncbi:MAG TPA: helix-turn-helix transcriptional regulator [Actinocrinis sp.]|uniref:helix-turn-helix domain-containing protein n=1 Tax=Actinocrinis sp. TaxID=1920516 RepID=UPI002DDD1A12|nr:helix-turn-helix transcriptional regulator [Actinocrinis sp.]HEV2347873.1 helix-turn-helix transcriptional regulator [Actinocrinis sp.]
MTDMLQFQRPIGDQLRQWRERRRLSQMDLALQAEVSTRHLSFVETGRSKPSREMILRLAEQLDLPLRERNHLLLAGGYAPIYAESALDSPHMAAAREAVRRLLTGHEPYPAAVVDRSWNIVDANAVLGVFTAGSAPWLLEPPANALRISLHPDGMAPRTINLGEWRAHLLGRVRRQVAITRDPELSELYDELLEYPCHQPEPEVEVPGPGSIFVPLRVQYEDRELAFFSTIATFGTPLDITVAELAIESFFPADEETRRFLLHWADDRKNSPPNNTMNGTASGTMNGAANGTANGRAAG